MLLSGTLALTWTSHLISIGPDQACVEVSEPPPSCTPISHTSGTISKEQAPFRPDCPLSCLPTNGPQRIGFRPRLGHTSFSNHVPPRGMVRDWCVCPQAARAVTAHRLQQGLCLHQRGAQGLDQAATRENALSSPSPFGRRWAFTLAIHRPAPGRTVWVLNHGARELFHGRCESRNPALLPAVQPTHFDQRRELPTVHSPTRAPQRPSSCGVPLRCETCICSLRDLPYQCDPHSLPSNPIRLSLGRPRERPPGPFSSTCRRLAARSAIAIAPVAVASVDALGPISQRAARHSTINQHAARSFSDSPSSRQRLNWRGSPGHASFRNLHRSAVAPSSTRPALSC